MNCIKGITIIKITYLKKNVRHEPIDRASKRYLGVIGLH